MIDAFKWGIYAMSVDNSSWLLTVARLCFNNQKIVCLECSQIENMNKVEKTCSPLSEDMLPHFSRALIVNDGLGKLFGTEFFIPNLQSNPEDLVWKIKRVYVDFELGNEIFVEFECRGSNAIIDIERFIEEAVVLL